jgi:hypothetical protein
MKKYEKPIIDIIKFMDNDVVTLSDDKPVDDGEDWDAW